MASNTNDSKTTSFSGISVPDASSESSHELTRERLTSHASQTHQEDIRVRRENSARFGNIRGNTIDNFQEDCATAKAQEEEDAQDAMNSAYESADMFADLEDNPLPRHRVSASETNELHDDANACKDTTSPSDINELSRSVFETFAKREEVLQKSYAETRFYMTENYLQSETTRYELLLQEMRSDSVLNSIDYDLAKLTLTNWDKNRNNQSLEAIRDFRVETTKTTWLLKSLKASEDFHLKSKLVRSMFRQTNQFLTL